MSEQITYTTVTAPSELDILIGNSTSYEGLTFDFSPEYINTLKERLDEPNAVQILATNNDIFAGYIAGAETIFPQYLFLSELFVSPDFAKKGIATELIKQSIIAAERMALRGVMTETENENIPAQNLYEKIGFKRIENPEWEGVTYQLNT